MEVKSAQATQSMLLALRCEYDSGLEPRLHEVIAVLVQVRDINRLAATIGNPESLADLVEAPSESQQRGDTHRLWRRKPSKAVLPDEAYERLFRLEKYGEETEVIRLNKDSPIEILLGIPAGLISAGWLIGFMHVVERVWTFPLRIEARQENLRAEAARWRAERSEHEMAVINAAIAQVAAVRDLKVVDAAIIESDVVN